MMLVVSGCLSAVALIVMIRKNYLTFDRTKEAKPIILRRLSSSFVIAISLYLSYRLEVYDWPYTLLYFLALPVVWFICIIVFWHVVDYVSVNKESAPANAPSTTQQKNYSAQSPVDRIYAWERQQGMK